jgi:hypothetical protein
MRAMQQAVWGGSEPLTLVEVEARRRLNEHLDESEETRGSDNIDVARAYAQAKSRADVPAALSSCQEFAAWRKAA